MAADLSEAQRAAHRAALLEKFTFLQWSQDNGEWIFKNDDRLSMYGIYVSENIMNGGGKDSTFDFLQTGPLAGTSEKTHNEVVEKVKEVREYRTAANQAQELAAQTEKEKSEFEEALKLLEKPKRFKSIQKASSEQVKDALEVYRKEAEEVSAKAEEAKKEAEEAMKAMNLEIMQLVLALFAEANSDSGDK